MKKLTTILIVFTITLLTGNLFAQGAYVNINAGYGFAMSSQNIDGFYNYTEGSDSYTNEQVNVSLGNGLNFGGTFGYMFSENVGAELGVSYLLGGKSEAKDEYSDGTTEYTYSSTMIRLIPSLVIAAGYDGVDPYAKFGAIIGSGSIIYDINDDDDGDISIMTMEMNGGIALGLNAAIGANFNMNDNMSFFAEINMVNMSYAPTKGEITEATINGTDMLPDMTTSVKEIEFVDSITIDSSSQPNDTQPRQELKTKYAFGSVGINVGLRIDF